MNNWLRVLPIMILLIACSLFSPESGPTDPQTMQPTPAVTEAVSGSSSTPVASPTENPTPPTEELQYKDLTVRPQIWFGPLDPWSWDQYFPGSGPFQYYDLFQTGAPWLQTSEAVHVIRLYPVWLESYAAPEQIEAVLDDIARRRIAISYEAGPLTETPLCNAATVEGFWGVPAAESIVSRIAAAGGKLYSMDLEHAFDAGTYYDVNCLMTPMEIAADAAKTIAAVRAVFPDVKIGSIETADLDPEAVAAWLQAFRDVMGTELDYFHLDINFSRPDWAARALEIQQVVNRRGIEFGIIYFGDDGDSSDEEWLAHAEARFVEYEVLAGGQPDHVIFQSWHRHPQKLYPEVEPGTFTNLILRYLRPRTVLTLESIDGLTLAGSLRDENSNAVSGADVQVRVRPLSGDGLLADYTITGIVPAEAQFADSGFRINQECECNGHAAFVLDQVTYLDSGQSANGVPNGSFTNGSNGWGIWGSGSVKLVPSLNGTGSALEVSVNPSQDAGMNSGEIQVTPGSEFTITFTARINPVTQNSGYFNIIFLNAQGEVRRLTLPIAAGEMVVAGAQTAADGSYQVSLQDMPAGELEYSAWYAGSGEFWPALGKP